MALRTLARTESLVLAALDTVLFAVFTGKELQVLHIQEGIDALLSQARAVGKAGLFVAHCTTPLPNDEVRTAITSNMSKLDPYLCCGATVIAKEGFSGSAIRAVVSTLQILSRPTHPERTFSSAAEASSFIRAELIRHHKNPPAVTAMIAAYGELTGSAWAPALLIR